MLDEADRLLDSEFLSQTQEVIAACTHPDLQKCVFSATLPAGAEKIAMSILKDPIRVVVGLKYVPLFFQCRIRLTRPRQGHAITTYRTIFNLRR